MRVPRVGAAATNPRLALNIAALAVSFVVGLSSVPRDDGLRHVGLAFGQARSWGDVYPLSQFALHADYDPWGGYDTTLRWLATVTGVFDLPRLTRQFVLVKALSVAFIAATVLLCLRRSRIGDALEDWGSFALAVPLLVVVLHLPVLRAATIRPFLFGTLFLLYSIGRSGALRGFCASGLALFMYPYLAWMYTGPVIVGHALRGSRSYSLGSLAATLLSIALQPASFWGLLVALLRSEATRAELGVQIGEFNPLFADWSLLVATVLALLVLIPLVPARSRELRAEHVVILLFYPLSLRYIRYFVDVLLPLLFVVYGADGLRVLRREGVALWRPLLGIEKTVARWRRLFGVQAAARPDAGPGTSAVPRGGEVLERSPGSSSTWRWCQRLLPLCLVLVLCCAGLGFATASRTRSQQDRLQQTLVDLSEVAPGSLAITDFNQQYELLYVRPDLSLVPSCEIGFPSEAIREDYRRYLGEGRVCTLARATAAEYVIDAGAQYLNPDDVGCLRLVRGGAKRRIWAVGRE
jgi:hypothetical protein